MKTLPAPPDKEAGFTLVEVLAALAVFSIAATGLVHISIENARTARLVETRALAGLLADNAMTDLIAAPGRLEQRTSHDEIEMSGRVWDVERQVRASGNPSILELNITVRLARDEAENGEPGPAYATLSAYRRAS